MESAVKYEDLDKLELISVITNLEINLSKYRLQVASLTQALSNIQRQVFGKKSEKLELSNQPALFDTPAPVLEKEPELEEIRYIRKKSKRGSKLKELPVVEEIIKPEITTCTCCQKELVQIGSEITERLEQVPAKLYKLRIIRPKYACSCKQSPVQVAELPAEVTVLEKCQAGVGLLTQIAIAKYCDHLPLHRQEQIYARHGIELSRKRLCDWLMRLSDLLEPLALEVKKYLLDQDYIKVDETTIKVQDTDSTDYIWTIAAKQVYYQYEASRSSESCNNLLGDYQGIIQSDAYAVYKNRNRLGCLAHARRKFVDLPECTEKTEVLNMFQKLYRIEKQIKGKDPEQILVTRKSESVPLLEKLKEYLDFIKDKYVPESSIVKAANYCLSDWQALTRYTTNPSFDIDNNAVERLIRPIAVGRKNWIFAQNARGAKAAAIFITLINSAKLVSVNPYEYLKDVLVRMQTHPNKQIVQLIPINWKNLNLSKN